VGALASHRPTLPSLRRWSTLTFKLIQNPQLDAALSLRCFRQRSLRCRPDYSKSTTMPAILHTLFRAGTLGLTLTGLIMIARSAENAPAPIAGNTCNVRDYGATGDGRTLDTAAINQAIESCSKAGGGRVVLPPGCYLSGTVRLRSHVTLLLEAGATLAGTTNLSLYDEPAVAPARRSKWEHALIVAEEAADFGICGPGTIDGRKVFDPTGEERMRGPHGINLLNCQGFALRDVWIQDAANYAVLFRTSSDVEVHNVRIVGGWDGVHFRGTAANWCRNVNIIGCQFYTGDDSVAGSYWNNTVIADCIVNSSCNGIRLIGPAQHLIVKSCLFYGPGMRPHRTQSRTNMLSGIILQPGGWDRTEGPLDDVLLANNVMRDVTSPITIHTKPGNRGGRITISGLDATGVYRAALSVESWADEPITNVVLRNARIEYTGGGRAEQAAQPVRAPGADARALPVWGIYARNVDQLTVEDVRLNLVKDDSRPVIAADRVGRLTLDNFKFPHVDGVAQFMMTTNIGKLPLRETDLEPNKR
jgi:hypothetical protein